MAEKRHEQTSADREFLLPTIRRLLRALPTENETLEKMKRAGINFTAHNDHERQPDLLKIKCHVSPFDQSVSNWRQCDWRV